MGHQLPRPLIRILLHFIFQLFVFGSFSEDETRSLLSKQSAGGAEKPVKKNELQFGSLNFADAGSLGSTNGDLSSKPSSTNGPVKFLSSTSGVEDGKGRKTATDHSSTTFQTPKQIAITESSTDGSGLSYGVKELSAKSMDVTSPHLSLNECGPSNDFQRMKFSVLESENVEGGDQNGIDNSLLCTVQGNIQKATTAFKNLLPRGLINSGNLCFLNATLQALLCCSPFVQLLQQLRLRNIPKVCIILLFL